MLTILMGRAKTGKSDRVLETIAALGDESQQILLVPEHASHQAEVDLCRVCGPTASRHAEVLSFRRLSDRVLGLTGGLSQVSLDPGGKLLTLQKALLEVAPELTVYRRPSQKAAFLQQMLDLFDELRCYEVTPRTLYDASEEMEGATRNKLRDLSLLYGAYEARLQRAGPGRPGPDEPPVRQPGGFWLCRGEGYLRRRVYVFQRPGTAGTGKYAAPGPLCDGNAAGRAGQPGRRSSSRLCGPWGS